MRFRIDHCIHTYGSESKWIGFIDADEFIVPRSRDPLSVYLKNFEQYGGLAISSLFFGESGNTAPPICGQIAGYRFRPPERLSFNRWVKMILQPDKVILPISPHSFLFKASHYCVNEKGNRVDAQRFPCHTDTIQVNHYFARSKQEWEAKIVRWKGDPKVSYSYDRRDKVNTYSTVEDTCILERLKSTLPGIPKDDAAWSKTINKNTTNLLTFYNRLRVLKPR